MATKVITLARRHGWKDESGGFESRSQVEAFMASIKEVGLVDTYDSNVDYVANNLSRPTGTDGLTLGIGGFLLKAGKPAFAVFIPPSEKGTLVFGHDSNSAQHDTTGRGLVIVLDPSVAEVRVVQVNVFERTYQNADGNPVHPDTDLPRIETT
ncbi:MAG: hypothetical protein D6719_07015 [Candidatus Dadabacteria bacterium]|nr:MAG: hypothetical protein D6719_07015 [Candidatus Dadabacteria bacterium]